MDVDLIGSSLIRSYEFVTISDLHIRDRLASLVEDVAAYDKGRSVGTGAQKQRKKTEKYFFHHFLMNSATHPPPLAIRIGSSSPALTVSVSIL